MTEASELQALLEATAAGDRRAFARLYTLTSAHLNAILLRMLKRRDWAEEALQDAYLRIWQHAGGYLAARGKPMTWMISIARHRALDLLRARRPELPEDAAAPEPTPDNEGPEALAETGERLGALEECMDGLPEEQRRSILMAYYEGYTHSELARRLDAPLGTVKSWVRRGLARLRDCLDALGAS